MQIKCIYCLKDGIANNFKKREHVIPQCYGTFTPDNIILRETVCDECNQYFGDKIELYLGRDTIEGIFRYKYGIKPAEPVKHHKRVKTKIDEGPLKGMIVLHAISDIPGVIDILPKVQAGFFNKNTQEYDYFEPQDIPTAKELEGKGYEIKGKSISLMADNEKEMDNLLKALKEKGMEVKPQEQLEWPDEVKKQNQTLVKSQIKIDPTIYRGFAKIAFNYLTFIAGKEFVLKTDFDGIRRFIRYGEGNHNEYFGVNEPPILHIDRIFNIQTTTGHLITVGWDGMNLVSRLSIFNITTYLIKLCNNYEGIWIPLKSGHHFDIHTKEISELHAINRKLLPRGRRIRLSRGHVSI